MVGADFLAGADGELIAGDFGIFVFGVLVGLLAGDVVRADFLADVAAVDAFGFGDFLGEVRGDGAFVFDGEVGDAEF